MNEPERYKRLVEEHYAAIWSGDELRIREQIAGNFVDHAMPPGTPQGVEPVLAFSRAMRTAFPDMKVTLQTMVAEGDLVAVHATWRGTHKGEFQTFAATNKSITFDGMVFWRVDKDKIAERWAVLDTAAMMKQLQAQ